MIEIVKKPLPGVLLLKLPRIVDHRGFFVKNFNSSMFKSIDLDFIPSESFFTSSSKDVLRGMHFQTGKSAHNKLVYCIQVSFVDTIVDVRQDSPFFNQPISILIKASEPLACFIPKGYAHGFLSLEDNTILGYLTDHEYDPSRDSGVLWSSINYHWTIKNPILSSRDSLFEDINHSRYCYESFS